MGGGSLTSDDTRRLDLVIGKATMLAAERHHDNLMEIRDRCQEKSRRSLHPL